MQVSEFGVRHWVKGLYDRCYYQELHLKGSLAMLIRGLQNLFVTRSYAFSTKMLERNSSLVFVPFRTLLFFLFYPFDPYVASREDWCYQLTEKFIRSSCSDDFIRSYCSNDYCEDLLQFIPLIQLIPFVNQLLIRGHLLQDGSEKGSECQPRGWRGSRTSSFTSSSAWGLESNYADYCSEHSVDDADDAANASYAS